MSPVRYVGQLADNWLRWYGRNSVIPIRRQDGTAATHESLLKLGKDLALHGEKIKHRLSEQDIQEAFCAWHNEFNRLGIPLRKDKEEYRRELVISIRGAQRKPWLNISAEKWTRWKHHPEFPCSGFPHEKILFAIRQHCNEAGNTEFFLAVRDAGLLADASFKTGARMLRKLVDNGTLEKIGKRQTLRYAQTYRLNF